MLTQICQYLRNWFDRDSHKNRLSYWEGEFTIESGALVGFSDRLVEGQYFRVIDSLLNDGVHQYPQDELRDETFTGTVQSMSIPQDVIELATEISDWINANQTAISSPYASESFAGYSYTLKSGTTATGDFSGPTWKSQFAARLAPWRKI